MRFYNLPFLLMLMATFLMPERCDAESNVLWYRAPATRWIDALALGNGRLGAMVFGGTAIERIGLNEDTLWSGGPYEPSTEVDRATREEIKRLMFSGEYLAAQNLANKLQGTPNSQSSYQTVGELRLAFPGVDQVENYRRELSLDNAIVTVTYAANGVNYRREIFVSPVDQVIVIRLTADRPGQISFEPDFVSPLETTVSATGQDIVLRGRNGDLLERKTKAIVAKGALRFESRARVQLEGGAVVLADGKLRVSGANAATVFVASATNFTRYDDISGDEAARVAAVLDGVAGKPYEAIKAGHVAEHRRLFDRVSFTLGKTVGSELPTDERVRNYATAADPALVALHFQFGRYLLISSSRPGTQPANLQGIWNDQLMAPWGGKYTVNINTQMNYWPAQVTNLAELEEPLFRMIEEVAGHSGPRTARRTYDAGGWVLHHNTDLWRPSAPIDTAFWGQWQTGGAWLAVQLYDSWRFSGDRDYLKKLYPILKGSAQFFLDALVEEPDHGWLVTLPSNSPEHFHLKGVTAAYGPTMDMQILRDLFDACIRSAETLGLDEDLRGVWASTRARLAPNQVGARGQLQEWIKDWDFNESTEPDHRHMSPLYGVYPGFDVTPADRKTFEAARVLAERRAQGSMGWANAWRIAIWARLLDAEKAGSFVDLMLSRWTEANLFDKPQTQLDGNWGFTAGVAEMLLQSHNGEIQLFPAWPFKKWPDGKITRLRARGGFEIDLEWASGALISVRVKSVGGTQVRVRLGEIATDLHLKVGEAREFGPGLK